MQNEPVGLKCRRWKIKLPQLGNQILLRIDGKRKELRQKLFRIEQKWFKTLISRGAKFNCSKILKIINRNYKSEMSWG